MEEKEAKEDQGGCGRRRSWPGTHGYLAKICRVHTGYWGSWLDTRITTPI